MDTQAAYRQFVLRITNNKLFGAY
jgi:hypothetical protein